MIVDDRVEIDQQAGGNASLPHRVGMLLLWTWRVIALCLRTGRLLTPSMRRACCLGHAAWCPP
jgi:hypothetical protein